METSSHLKSQYQISVPFLVPYVETAVKLIEQYSPAKWAKDPESSEYKVAHLALCTSLYRYSNLSDESKEGQKEFQLHSLAISLAADVKSFSETYKL